MPSQMLFFSEVGEMQTDEKVVCDKAVTIDGNARYKGYLNYIGSKSILGNTSATFGVWTAVSKGGDRLNVLLSGPPDAATDPGDSDTISYDLKNGVCYTTTNRTVYFRYQGHGPLEHGAADVLVNMAGFTAPDGEATTLLENQEGQFRNFSRGYAYQGISGRAPSSEATITFSNGTESVTMTIPTNGDPSKQEFSEILKVTAAQTLTISVADGFDMNGWVIGLRGP